MISISSSSSSRLCGYIPEPHPTLVEVKLVFTHVGGEVEIHQPVVVKITGGYPSPVVEVLIDQDVGIGSFGQGIFEINSGLFYRQQFKERLGWFFG